MSGIHVRWFPIDVDGKPTTPGTTWMGVLAQIAHSGLAWHVSSPTQEGTTS